MLEEFREVSKQQLPWHDNGADSQATVSKEEVQYVFADSQCSDVEGYDEEDAEVR